MSGKRTIRSLIMMLLPAVCLFPLVAVDGGCPPYFPRVPTEVPPVTPTLFVANGWSKVFVSYANPATLDGDIPPTTILTNDAVGVAGRKDFVVDAGGALLISDSSWRSITAFDDAITASGSIPPDRTIHVQATGLAGVAAEPLALASDNARDLLFVATGGPPSPAILVLANASTADGDVVPVRKITNTALQTLRAIHLDHFGNLFVANNADTGTAIMVYANAAELDGNITPTRTIQADPPFAEVWDIALDDSDRLYVVNSFITPRIDVFEHASALDGVVSPSSSLVVSGGGNLMSIAVDSQGRGYIAIAGNAIFSYDNIATLNGTFPPTRTISGGHTLFSLPLRVFLLE